DIILFADRERAFLGECRSVELLKEEEAKHVALFRRYATHLRSLRPSIVEAFAPFLARCHEFHRAATENTLGLSVPVFHYQCWLYGLMLEESSIHLYDKIAVDRDRLNPAWLSAHRAHRQEELQHVVTDAVYARALNITDDDRRRISKLWFDFIAGHWGRIHGIEAAWELLALVYPEAASAVTSPLRIPPAYLRDLLHHRAFVRTREAAPYIGKLAERSDEEALAALAPPTRGKGSASAIVAEALGAELASARVVAAVREARGDARFAAMRDYLSARVVQIGGASLDRVGTDVHMLDTGVDSVSALEIVERIKVDFGVEVPVARMFDSTIGAIITSVLTGLDAAAALVPLEEAS
ncbi:MAG TPA: acyl carrier protein, partial [Labilithrix sp.]|nr:acyl carrier protein [Labilithrix sp.]